MNGKGCSAITEKEYWDKIHLEKHAYTKRGYDDFRVFCDRLILEKIKEYYRAGSLLEIGAGSSDWLISLAQELKPTSCVGLDYSEAGCRALSEMTRAVKVNLDVVLGDVFSPPDHLLGQFEFVVSFGVVEHFSELPDVLDAAGRFLSHDGVLFTLIPNMAGVNGFLTKAWNREVYDMHVPHDLESFAEGHRDAGLEVIWGGYLGSTNFSVLSSCFTRKKGVRYWCYKQLTRISKGVWYIESKLKRFPAIKLFSPYIVVVSRVRT